MPIDIRAKGQNGEREVCDMLNSIIFGAMMDLGYAPDMCRKALECVQRNQNQSAVGGNDLTNTFGLSIEIKRQEQLSIKAWWAQCKAAAARNNEVPVLMYRQNRKAWRVVTNMWLYTPANSQMQTFGEIDIETFKQWFKQWVIEKLSSGYELRI